MNRSPLRSPLRPVNGRRAAATHTPTKLQPPSSPPVSPTADPEAPCGDDRELEAPRHRRHNAGAAAHNATACAFLGMPFDALELIAELTPASDLAHLAMTCHALGGRAMGSDSVCESMARSLCLRLEPCAAECAPCCSCMFPCNAVGRGEGGWVRRLHAARLASLRPPLLRAAGGGGHAVALLLPPAGEQWRRQDARAAPSGPSAPATRLFTWGRSSCALDVPIDGGLGGHDGLPELDEDGGILVRHVELDGDDLEPEPRVVQYVDGAGVAAVAAGTRVTYLIDAEGGVRSCGDNTFGLLGHEFFVRGTRNRFAPIARFELSVKIEGVSAGVCHALAVAQDGRLFSWGDGRHGKLGHGDEQDMCEPAVVQAMRGAARCLVVSAGQSHSVVATDCGVWTFGCNALRQLGQFGTGWTRQQRCTRVPKRVRGPAGWDLPVVSVAAGTSHTLAIDDQGTVYSWGSNDYGQLGRQCKQPFDDVAPKVVHLPRGAVGRRIDVGAYHSAIVTTRGRLLTCGRGAHGQLGRGAEHRGDEHRLQAVRGGRDNPFVAVSCGANHTLASTADGRLFECGSVGVNEAGGRDRPVQLPGRIAVAE